MKKAIINTIALLIFSAGMVIQVEGAQSAPPWMAESGFQNQNRVSGRPVSSGVMAESFRHLFRSYVRYTTENFVGIDAFRGMQRDQFNPHLNVAARHAIHVGLDDLFFDYVWTGRDFLRAVSDTAYFKFAQYARDTGYLLIFDDHSRIFVASDLGEEVFVHLLLDELGSAFFGFSESMAAFFAERGRGIEYAQHGPNIKELIERYHAKGTMNPIGILIGGGSLAYDTNFERVLENVLAQQGRAHELWDAAMASHAAQRDLWNNTPEVANLIGFDDLQMVRGVSLAMGRGFRSRPELHQIFEETAGMTYEEFARQFARHWYIITGVLHPEFEVGGKQPAFGPQREAVLRYFQEWTRFVVEFGTWQRVEPDISVAEEIMELYRLRYEDGIF